MKKYFNKIKVLLVFLLLVLTEYTISQPVIYDQIIKGQKVGTLKVFTETSEKTNEFEIKVKSEVKVNFLFLSAHVEYEGRAEYQSGKLMYSLIEIFKDGEMHEKGETTFKNGSYYAEIDGRRKIIPSVNISYSSLKLYHHEPKEVKDVYAEVDGIFNSITYVGDGVYQLKLDESRTNTYTYKNGRLVQAKLDHWLAPIRLKIRE
nr:hypothetical protein [Saprospiraceae bacterium]